MRKVLIVSPHFPPVDTPDMHRVRMSLPHFREFGWMPFVLAVEPLYIERVIEQLLLETIPEDVPIHRVKAVPFRWARKVGIGDIGLRSLPLLYRAGAELIQKHKVDLIYFSTTAFITMTLGRIWKERYGIPYVLDMQDPWVSDLEHNGLGFRKPAKYRFTRRLHRKLELWTMKKVDGLLAVSGDYIDALHRRYPWLSEKPHRTLPFGVSQTDFDLVRKHPQTNRFFQPGSGQIHGVYVGRGGRDMAVALRIIFEALRLGLQERQELFSRLKLHFIGTDYAPANRASKTVEPVATQSGVSDYVNEDPIRIPYFEALQLLLDADFLLVPGSDDPHYTASKIYPYILAGKPLLGVFNERSSVCAIIRCTLAGSILPFSPEKLIENYPRRFLDMWLDLLSRLPFVPKTIWDAFTPYTAREMTRQQCHLFDEIMEGVPPPALKIDRDAALTDAIKPAGLVI